MEPISSRLLFLATLWTFICIIIGLSALCVTKTSSHRDRTGNHNSQEASNDTDQSSKRRKIGDRIVTIACENILCRRSDDTDGVWKLVKDAIESLEKLAKTATVIPIGKVKDDDEQNEMFEALKLTGLIGKTGLIPPHRVLFCSTDQGRVSMVRQIGPTLHFESSLEAMKGFKVLKSINAVYVNLAEDLHQNNTTVSTELSGSVMNSVCDSFNDCLKLYQAVAGD